MTQSVAVVNNFQLGGIGFNLSETFEADEVYSVIVEVPAAQPSTLSTRTDNDTGILTMDNADHGILTADIIDLYFSGGARRRVVVGTVSGVSVPFGAVTAGAGDNLPIATTAIVACVVIQRSFPATVADIVKIAIKADVESQFSFMEANGTTEDHTEHLEPSATGIEAGWTWDSSFGATPITGTMIAEVWVSHADTEAAHTMYAAYLSN